MSVAIAIFVKTPQLSPVKTRLAKTIGRSNAEAFHLLAAQAVAETVQHVCQQYNIQGYFAVAEQSAVNCSHWQQLPCVWQGEGDLGDRMAHIYQILLAKHTAVILVGADIPQMTSSILLNACLCLTKDERARLAFAPSEDGGFWLIGGNINIAQNIWTDVAYSKAQTGADFLRAIKPLGDIQILPTLRDVDEVNDLVALHHALGRLDNPLVMQSQLFDFLKGVLAENTLKEGK